jgi:hypothetical protein
MVRKYVLSTFFLALFVPALAAQTSHSVSTEFDTSVRRTGDDVEWAGAGATRLTVESEAASAVKAVIQAGLYADPSISHQTATARDALVSDGFYFTLEKAYLKIRLPGFIDGSSSRLSFGKMPVAWGQGAFFNAGDILFGAAPNQTSLFSSEYRTDTDWMVVFYLPLGDWSFVEIIGSPPMRSGETGRGGGRFVFTPGWAALNSIEAGYLYGAAFKTGELLNTAAAEAAGRQLYASLDGTLYFDYSLSTSLTVYNTETDSSAGAVYNSWKISAGIFRIWSINGGARSIPVSFRMEGLFAPAHNALNIFSMLNFDITENITLLLSALASTKDYETWTAPVSVGSAWQVLQGLSLGAAFTVEADNPDKLLAVSFSGKYSF